VAGVGFQQGLVADPRSIGVEYPAVGREQAGLPVDERAVAVERERIEAVQRAVRVLVLRA